MKLKDIGFIPKSLLSIKTLYTPFSFRHLSRVNTQQAESYKYRQITSSIYKFNSPKCLFDWVPIGDRQIGGDSQPDISYHEQGKFMRLQGRIVTHDKDRMLELPYVAAILDTWKDYKIRLHSFNLIKLRIRTDGHPVRFICKFQSLNMRKMTASALIVDQSKQWQWFEIPFVNFERSKNDEVDEPMSTLGKNATITEMVLSSSSDKDRNVSFDISEIAASFVPGLERFTIKYKKPIFYKCIQNYDRIVEINNGRESVFVKM